MGDDRSNRLNMELSRIRNFSIIAHIDHGKSTLADRFLQFTGAIGDREFRNQVLDDMDLERERGITIKASAVKIAYKAKDGIEYLLNFIDTPGHVDFTYEVSKSLAAVEGALLLVDAAQGVEAQTVANLYLAMEHDVMIIPVINKIDLANAQIDDVKHQISSILDFPEDEIILASAKEGIGTEEILERIVKKVPLPSGSEEAPLQVLVFDSNFNTYKGVIIYVRVFNGYLKPNMKIQMMSSKKVYQIQEVGVFKPHPTKIDRLSCGEVGYITCNIRDAKEVSTGDTITDALHPAAVALPGYKKMLPMVYSGIYPVNAKDFKKLRDAVEKLRLSDASFVYEPESSVTLGYGFRCGFLGLLHMEIVQERLEREFDLNLVMTTPSVIYQVRKINGELLEVDNPSKMPPPNEISETLEPYARAYIMLPKDSMGSILELAESKRGEYVSTEYLDENKARLVYLIPLSEVIVDFYDKIKSMTRGYGSLDYEFLEYRVTKLVRLDILINDEPCDALSSLVFKDKAYNKGRALVDALKDAIPRQLYQVAIQAAIGTQVIARSSVRALSKDVTAKCYGGDITRKRKLWAKQKKGKKRMKQFGKVQIPQEAFLAALKV